MSPEQLAKQDLDARSDIFSFGITLYELFSGRHPCTGPDAGEVGRQLCSPKYVFSPPSRHNGEITAPLDRIVLKAIQRAPNDRYQSVADLIADLEHL